jgi:oxygen-dependent protoporphyrinogen oxidase
VQGLRRGVVRLIEVLLLDAEAFGADLRTNARVRDADPGGVTLESGERITGTVVYAAPAPAADPRRVTLVTLVVDAPDLDAAPRGTGVLVAAGAGVGARALTHVTAKWEWVAAQAAGRHVLRLSCDAADEPDIATATRDAGTLLGVPLTHPEDAAIVTWERAAPRTHAVDGMHYVGEAVSGTGIAAVVAQADAIQIETGPDDAEPQG